MCAQESNIFISLMKKLRPRGWLTQGHRGSDRLGQGFGFLLPWLVGFQIPDWVQGLNLGPCSRCEVLNLWTTREVPGIEFRTSLFFTPQWVTQPKRSWKIFLLTPLHQGELRPSPGWGDGRGTWARVRRLTSWEESVRHPSDSL